ncbi:MAG TPA: CBS domain-containing protein [Actinomycetota bacterium]|jgi:CBS domain-containing protein|nr:CBS domain-containing protein [Actinomycetota bacterium]
MSTEVVGVGPVASVTEAVSVMSRRATGSVLVLDGGSLVGIFTERDVLRALLESPSADVARVSPVSRWMTREPITVAPGASVGDALNEMLFRGFRHLPVLEDDAVVGVVSMRDLAGSVAKGRSVDAPD